MDADSVTRGTRIGANVALPLDSAPPEPMDDATPPQHPETAAAPRRRRKALHVPLPAVVVGLGLASGAAVGQVPQVIARDDAYSVPAFTAVTLPVMANDTVNVFAFTFIYAFTPPAHGFANVLSGMQSLVYQGNPGFRGVDSWTTASSPRAAAPRPTAPP